ncbi:hypothetical protein EVAR_52385_1 [Eumeta japonica]|uniref:Uncharacterized protein n=1 Tax=Eumeta variegata TaxID=151549 RepID=A0A4C1ZGC3_EUMVA|nr:hypothetical protein EVAR_52385_1 [Eumeta japonica]
MYGAASAFFFGSSRVVTLTRSKSYEWYATKFSPQTFTFEQQATERETPRLPLLLDTQRSKPGTFWQHTCQSYSAVHLPWSPDPALYDFPFCSPKQNNARDNSFRRRKIQWLHLRRQSEVCNAHEIMFFQNCFRRVKGCMYADGEFFEKI